MLRALFPEHLSGSSATARDDIQPVSPIEDSQGPRPAASLSQKAMNIDEVYASRVLVVIELNGGNDGLDSVVPFRNEAYYRARPTICVKPENVLKAEEEVGFHPCLVGLKSLYDSGVLSIVHGCGYPNPSHSHFESMEVWHTASLVRRKNLGWLGRLADLAWSNMTSTMLINIAEEQSLALRAANHSPFVFQNSDDLLRDNDHRHSEMYRRFVSNHDGGNSNLAFLAKSLDDAIQISSRTRKALQNLSMAHNYGSSAIAQDLRKVAALLSAGFPTRVYYLRVRGFDTHAGQVGRRHQLLGSIAGAVECFYKELKQIRRDRDVSIMIFSEFGRRVAENASGGTDHGTAGPVFLVGSQVVPGFHQPHPSLTDLDEDGNLKMTVDFRRVYASVISEWFGYLDLRSLFEGDIVPLQLFKIR